MFFVYVLKSTVDGRLYKGLTSNVEKRLAEHNTGKTKSTKSFAPWELIYSKQFANRLDARKHEIFLKSGDGRNYLKKILAEL